VSSVGDKSTVNNVNKCNEGLPHEPVDGVPQVFR
jgi:hypothetical protein